MTFLLQVCLSLLTVFQLLLSEQTNTDEFAYKQANIEMWFTYIPGRNTCNMKIHCRANLIASSPNETQLNLYEKSHMTKKAVYLIHGKSLTITAHMIILESSVDRVYICSLSNTGVLIGQASLVVNQQLLCHNRYNSTKESSNLKNDNYKVLIRNEERTNEELMNSKLKKSISLDEKQIVIIGVAITAFGVCSVSCIVTCVVCCKYWQKRRRQVLPPTSRGNVYLPDDNSDDYINIPNDWQPSSSFLSYDSDDETSQIYQSLTRKNMNYLSVYACVNSNTRVNEASASYIPESDQEDLESDQEDLESDQEDLESGQLVSESNKIVLQSD